LKKIKECDKGKGAKVENYNNRKAFVNSENIFIVDHDPFYGSDGSRFLVKKSSVRKGVI